MLKTKKQLWLWIGLGVLAVLLVAAVCLAAALGRDDPEPTEPSATEGTTLPPPSENVFTPMDFGYKDGYLTCLSAESVLGIDVSTHQKEIDWAQVKAAGVEFVMIRIGYRGSEQGLLFEDEWAQRNYEGAKAAGLKVGGYFFSQSISPEEAVEEAGFAMDIISGWELDMPLVYDWEYISAESRTGNVDARLLTDCTKAFCDTVRAAGAGGQHINKTSSAIRITHLPTGTVVECQDERSQYKNKDKAMKVLKSRLLSEKQQEQSGAIAAERKSQVGTGDRSERIRTYNYRENRVTDHRIGLTVYRLDAILEGSLDEVIDPMIAAYRAEQLKEQQS